MIRFETTTLTVASQQRCEDRVKVLAFDTGVVIVVADGAGGTGAGSEAAETVIREITTAASLEHDSNAWCEILGQIDQRIGAGEATGVVVAWSSQGLVGASVGDSKAWLLENDEINDLTRGQIRKPLLGSGKALPVGFSPPPLAGTVTCLYRRL